MASEAKAGSVTLSGPPPAAPRLTPNLGIDELIPSPTNPRKDAAKARIPDMAASIRTSGLLEPILARPWPGDRPKPKGYEAGSFEIVDGERRWRGAREIALAHVPVLVREMTDLEVLKIQLVKNKEREDIHPLDESEEFDRYIVAMRKSRGTYEANDLADELGMSRSHVYQRLQLQKLTPEAVKAYRAGEETGLTTGHAVEIARLTPEDQRRALKATIQERHVEVEPDRRGEQIAEEERKAGKAAMSVRELRAWIGTNIHLSLAKAPWALDDETLVTPKAGLCAGPCTICPYNTAVSPELFPEIKRQHGICTNPAGYDYKLQGWIDRLKAKATEEHGGKVLEVSARDEYSRGGPSYPKLGRDWQKAGSEDCPDTKTAIVVQLDPWERTGLKLGQVLKACTKRDQNKWKTWRFTCPVHNKQERRASVPSPEGKRRAKELRERRLLRESRAAIFAALFAKDGQPVAADWRLVAEEFIDGLYESAERVALGTLYGWTRPAKFKPSRYARPENAAELTAVRTVLKSGSAAQLERLTFAAFLAGRVASNDTESRTDQDPLLVAARTHKVDLEKIKADAKAATSKARSDAAAKGTAGRLTKARTVKGSKADKAAKADKRKRGGAGLLSKGAVATALARAAKGKGGRLYGRPAPKPGATAKRKRKARAA